MRARLVCLYNVIEWKLRVPVFLWKSRVESAVNWIRLKGKKKQKRSRFVAGRRREREKERKKERKTRPEASCRRNAAQRSVFSQYGGYGNKYERGHGPEKVSCSTEDRVRTQKGKRKYQERQRLQQQEARC